MFFQQLFAKKSLEQLAAEAKYQPLVDRALKNVELINMIKAEGAEPTLSFEGPVLIFD